jgi:hypothetical protein
MRLLLGMLGMLVGKMLLLLLGYNGLQSLSWGEIRVRVREVKQVSHL